MWCFRPSLSYIELLEPEFAKIVRDASSTYDNERQTTHKVSFIAFKQVPWHHYSRFAVEQSQVSLRSPFLDNDIVSLAYQAPLDLLFSNEPSLRLIKDENCNLARIPTDRGLLYQQIPIITKLQNQYAEFTAKAEYAYDYGMPQWLAVIDHIFTPLHIDRIFLGRHKFYHFRIWYRDQLSNYLKEIFLDTRTRNRPYFKSQCIEQIVRDHTSGRRNYTREIHRILTSELIQRTLIEQR